MNAISTSLLVLGLFATAAWGQSSAGPLASGFATHAAPAPADGDEKKGGEKKQPKPKFKPAKETTYVTGPLDADGYIDYAAALNERLGKGVKPQDNANVQLWKALGPRPEGGDGMPAEFFKWMGTEAPPEKGEYFTDLFKYLKERGKIDPQGPLDEFYDQQSRMTQRPWTAKDYPHIADWLKANEKPLALAVEATKRPHYFNPLVPSKSKQGSGGLISALLPGVQKCREIANALTARAMLRVGEGRFDEAWQDLLACHRLGRLAGRGATLIEALVGIAIDQVASNAEVTFLAHAKLDAKQTLARLDDLRKLPPMPAMADKIDLGERFMFLDTTMMIRRHGIQYLEGRFNGGPPTAPAPQPLNGIDLEPVLRNGNRWYNRIAAALRLRDRAAREREFDRIEDELRKLKQETMDWKWRVGLLFTDAEKIPAVLGEKIGNVLIGLLVPAIRKVQSAADRSEQVERNLHLAFALAAYHRDNKRYPPKLEALAPKYLPEVPGDLFSGKALIYRPAGEGYLLYSVGANGVDEEGRWFDDEPRGDDPRVRMPLPELPRR